MYIIITTTTTARLAGQTFRGGGERLVTIARFLWHNGM